MSVVLTTTWNPRGELPRLEKLLPELERAYRAVLVVVGPDPGPELLAELRALDFGSPPDTGGARRDPQRFALAAPDWSRGRHIALQAALAVSEGPIHYADLDRLLRWVETRPAEWRESVARIGTAGCVIHGRTPAAYRTHPQALLRTEAISNAVVSHLLGRAVDASAGSKGFSRPAARFLAAHSRPGNALGTDAAWPVLLQRAGYSIDYVEVDGLDWEIPDQYQPQAAGPERQARQAEAYDADPHNWARRAAVALEIVQAGLAASQQPLPGCREPLSPS